MLGLPLAFASPLVLGALVALPIIWWLLRLTPPKPQAELFPPLAILARLIGKEETPAQSPWWLTLLRLLMAALVILAMAGPVHNPETPRLAGDGPLVLVVDNGWASGRDWERQRAGAMSLVAEARDSNRPVYLIETANPVAAASQPLDPGTALARLDAMENHPLQPDHSGTAQLIEMVFAQSGAASVHLLSDGLDHAGTQQLARSLSRDGVALTVTVPPLDGLAVLAGVRNDPDAMLGTVIRPAGSDGGRATVTMRDVKGLPLARRTVELPAGGDSVEFRFDEPVELRNQAARVMIDDVSNAGAVQLLDERFRRRLVGLVSGEAGDGAQPLLSPLYYIARALAPFSDLRRAGDANVASAIPELTRQGVSAIILADVGNLPDQAAQTLAEWVENGGMLIRFAGPRLAAAPEDELLPVRLRGGGRNLGGALSWETPKPVAPFDETSPFFGLDAPRDVLVTRQVLALQDIDLERRTWAVLDDGTPLVTADRRGGGWIVLFHVSSDASWSNLPISGTFVEMLRRVVNQSRSSGAQTVDGEPQSLPPLQTLDGKGRLGAPPANTKPLVTGDAGARVTSIDNPPGLYGTEDGFSALNLFGESAELSRLDRALFGSNTQFAGYTGVQAQPLKHYLLAAAALLLLLDCLAVIWISGAIRFGRRGSPVRAAMIAGLVATALTATYLTPEAAAQTGDTDLDFAAALETRIAYVETGVSDVDAVSMAGMFGLTQFISGRTALEPGEPVGLDISSDELAFYSLIYWPISVEADLPTPETMARVDAFMKQGGTVLFDTRDQVNGLTGGTAGSPEARRLQAILSSLDIPPLEPVPSDHVLTKAFYLLDRFPGRYAAGELWVEAIGEADENDTRPARAGDGVSSIIITSNDFAAAWAMDQSFRPLFPTVPPDPRQRELSYRTGVNLMMYALTGNYKADQVHIPALLERLGQ